jgi:cytochrome P450
MDPYVLEGFWNNILTFSCPPFGFDSRLREKGDRSLLPGTVKEPICRATPVQHFTRTASADTEIGIGEHNMINFVAANHDPARHRDPCRLDATCCANRHLVFAAGACLSLGLYLAKIEMRIPLETVLDSVGSIELARVQSAFSRCS